MSNGNLTLSIRSLVIIRVWLAKSSSSSGHHHRPWNLQANKASSEHQEQQSFSSLEGIPLAHMSLVSISFNIKIARYNSNSRMHCRAIISGDILLKHTDTK
jgi:hypothetical protein